MSRNIKLSATVAVTAVLLATTGTAIAQLDNKPFSFRNSPGGGSGMSTGGKQAIINEKLFDSTPHNLMRGSNGELVDVVEGPGNSVIVFEHGTTSSIPGFRGTSFRDDNVLMEVGTFNAYFGPNHDNNSFISFTNAQFHTSGTIDSWTVSVVSQNGLYPYNSYSSVDRWTTFVNSLNRF